MDTLQYSQDQKIFQIMGCQRSVCTIKGEYNFFRWKRNVDCFFGLSGDNLEKSKTIGDYHSA